MTETKKKTMEKAAQLSVKAALVEYLADFERYTDYETELDYCDMHANYDSSIDPVEFINQSLYRECDYYVGHVKYRYQFELIEKITRAIHAL